MEDGSCLPTFNGKCSCICPVAPVVPVTPAAPPLHVAPPYRYLSPMKLTQAMPQRRAGLRPSLWKSPWRILLLPAIQYVKLVPQTRRFLTRLLLWQLLQGRPPKSFCLLRALMWLHLSEPHLPNSNSSTQHHVTALVA